MDKIKVCFLSWHFETPEIFLNSILKMTPKCSGVWKNIEATTNIKEADYYFIMDGYDGFLPDAEKKAIYFGEHPHTPYSPVNKRFEGKKALLKLPLEQFLNPGEWWVSYNYDELVNLKPSNQEKDLICIMTYQTHHPMYAQRPKFVAELVKKHPFLPLNLYGRPSDKFLSDDTLKSIYKGVLGNEKYDPTKGEHIVGKDIMRSYKYSLEFDVGECVNYFSERFYDAILLWCTPIYFGCTNLSTYLPHENKAYFTFNQNNLTEIDKISNIIQTPKYWKELEEVRNLLLNKYQMWAYCHFIINNIDKMLDNPNDTFQKWIKGEIS